MAVLSPPNSEFGSKQRGELRDMFVPRNVEGHREEGKSMCARVQNMAVLVNNNLSLYLPDNSDHRMVGCKVMPASRDQEGRVKGLLLAPGMQSISSLLFQNCRLFYFCFSTPHTANQSA